jgi:hypothetical protein
LRKDIVKTGVTAIAFLFWDSSNSARVVLPVLATARAKGEEEEEDTVVPLATEVSDV